MICDLLALRPISHITKKTLSYLHSTKIEQMTKTMVIFKRGAIFLCCIRCDPIPPQTSVQRLAHTRNVTTCCWCRVADFDNFVFASLFPVCQGKISQRTRPSYGVKSSGLDRILVSYFRSVFLVI